MKKCSIASCDRPVDASGMCSTHYRRLRLYGDPLGGGPFRARPGEPIVFLLEAAEYQGDNCLTWPFARNSAGYGHLRIEGVGTLAHRIVCERAHGAPPGGAEAAHLCGNGHLSCINKRHLAWKSREGNMKDMIAHGRSRRGGRQWMSRLTESDVRNIMNFKGIRLAKDIAGDFGVTAANIVAIWRGVSWGWLTGASPTPTQSRGNRIRPNGPFLTVDEVREIRSLAGKKSAIELAKTYEVGPGTIRKIISGASWARA